MRHMGNSGKFAVVTGIVAAGLLVLTGMTLAMPVFVAFAGVLGLTYLSCVLELILRRRHVVLVLGGVCTSLAVAGTLAFLGTWELSFEGQSSLIGTPLPTNDPDTYFILAAGSLVAAFVVLFAGAAWPGRTPIRKAPVRRARARQNATRQGPSRPAPTRQAAPRTSQPRPAQPRTTAGGRAPVRQSPSSAQRKGGAAKGTAKQGPAVKGAPKQGGTKQTPPRQPGRKPAPRR